MANEENLKPFQKGEDERRNIQGRPRKYISALKEQGYKLSEINDCIAALMSMTKEELEEVDLNEKATIMERTIAAAMLKGYDKKSLFAAETLLSRVHGKPVEKKEEKLTGELTINVSFNEETKEADGH